MLIPYLFGMAEQQTFKRSGEILPWINKQEDLLVPTLSNNSRDKTGISGFRAYRQGKTVKVKPSSIYWNGMRIFEILRDENLSISNVCEIIHSQRMRKIAIELKPESKRDDGSGYDDETATGDNMAIFSGIAPRYTFMDEGAIELTKEEAEYLYQKMTTAQRSRGSLLAFMLKEKILIRKFEDIMESVLPDDLKMYVRLAKSFADFIYGAHVRYNVVFSRSSDSGEDEEMIEKYREWSETFEFAGFDLATVLSKVNANARVTVFLQEFYEHAKNGNLEAVDRLIIRREKEIKCDRAKLDKPQEYRYDPGRRIHYYKLNYRYGSAYAIISDILSGLEE